MSHLTDELYWMSEETNDLIQRLLDYRNRPQTDISTEDAARVDNDMTDALGHLLKAQSCLVSSALFARHSLTQAIC